MLSRECRECRRGVEIVKKKDGQRLKDSRLPTNPATDKGP